MIWGILFVNESLHQVIEVLNKAILRFSTE